MSYMVGPWRLATMQGLLRATLPTKAVTMSMYVTPVASSWTIWVAYTVATVGSINVSGCLGLGEPQWEPERVDPSAGRPQPPWSLGAVQPLVWAPGTLVMMLNHIAPAWPACIPWLFCTGPSFPLHSGCSIATSTHSESGGLAQQGSQSKRDAAPLMSQESCLIRLPHRGCLLHRCHCRGHLFGGLFGGVASSIDISAGSSSSVGSSVGAVWVSTGVGAQVHPS